VPVLIEVLLTDKKPGVRAEAAQTLGRLRPVSQQVGQALEQARDKDPSMRVRMQARSSLLNYHWSGYRGVKKDEPSVHTPEPPLAPPNGAAPPQAQPQPPPPQPQPQPQPRLEPRPQPQPPAPQPAPQQGPPVPAPPGSPEPPLAPPAPQGPQPLPPGPPDNGPALPPPQQ
jgi:hypothetical protein